MSAPSDPADPAAPRPDPLGDDRSGRRDPVVGVRQHRHAVPRLPAAGVPRDAFEKVEDAATVARYTGIAKTVALHIPWDDVDDFGALADFASERGIRIGGINSNTFQDEDYKLGSLCHPVAAVRRKAIDRDRHAAATSPAQTGSDIVKVWLADGTNYPGQDDFRARRRRLIDAA